MQLILDNMLASMVGGMVLLLAVAVGYRDMLTTVDATNSYALKQQELTFIKVLQQDLHAAKRVETPEEDPLTKEFRFVRSKSLTDPTEITVTYRREFVEMRDSVALYRIQRIENGNVYDGSSMLTVTDWQIAAWNEDRQPINSTNLSEAAQIYVRFEAAAPFKEDKNVVRSRWEATFHPPLLRPGTVVL